MSERISGPKKRSAGRPPFKPTPEQRRTVEQAVGLGMTQKDIAQLVTDKNGKPIAKMTLRRHFERELQSGIAKMHSAIGASLTRRALDLDHPQGAACAIFYAKTRMGWRETTGVEIEAKSGVLVVPAGVTAEEWIKAKAKEKGDG